MYCPNCRSQLIDGSIYCPVCGTQLAQVQQVNYQQPVQQPVQQMASNGNYVQQPTQSQMPYFYKSIKNSCQKSRIDYDRLFQSAVKNGDDYEQFIIDVNDEVNKNIAWILKVCSGGNHDAELELLNLNNGLDSIYSLMHNKQFVYKCNSNSTMEFLMNGMHEQDDAGYDFMQFFDDFEDSFYNFRLKCLI